MEKSEYDEIITANSFDIIIRCKRCQAVGGFIGVKNINMNPGGVDIVCTHCGHVEDCY